MTTPGMDPGIEGGEVVDRRAARRRTIGFTLGMGLLVAFFIGIWLNNHYRLPDANDPAVIADTARAVAAIEGYVTTETRGATSTRCAARLLGRSDGAALVHAACSSIPGPIQVSGPYRVGADGSVRTARDGQDFSVDVKSMFGSRLGDWYLNNLRSFVDIRAPKPAGNVGDGAIPSR